MELQSLKVVRDLCLKNALCVLFKVVSSLVNLFPNDILFSNYGSGKVSFTLKLRQE